MLPSLVASGIGALILTGLGRWTGVELGTLSVPALQAADSLDVGDLL
jgi:hypothetical protein